MAIIKCPECEKEISDKAIACIHCGCPLNFSEHGKSDNYDIILNSDANKYQVIKILMELKSISLVDAKNIVDNTLQIIFRSVTLNESANIINKLKSVSADITIEMENKTNNIGNIASSAIVKETVNSELNVKNESVSTQTNTSNIVDKKKNMGCGITIAIIIVIILICALIGNSTNHDDGKCDICGKKAVKSSSDYEYCLEHYVDAVDYYYKEYEQNDNYGGFN